MINWYIIYAYALGQAFIVSAVLTSVMGRLALRWGVMDHPGERKMQKDPIPLLGGVAICVTFYAVITANLLFLAPVQQLGVGWLEDNVLTFLDEGAGVWTQMIGLLVGGLMIFLLGLADDIYALKPELKLAGQIMAALVLVGCGIRLDVFITDFWEDGWYVTALSSAVTVFWLVMMTNAMNFLDNMDGLASGVSVIAAFSFFLCIMPDQTFVCVLLMVFAGSVAGFLFHNFNPARIYMGDAGSMFCGFLLGTVAVLGTFYAEDTQSRVAVAAPVLALSVPIFDTISVVWIRWRRGESIMKGDKRHFSHRLVDAGMAPHQAVEFIYLVAIVVGLGAALLPQVDFKGTLVILAQTIGVFSLIVILMYVGNKRREAS